MRLGRGGFTLIELLIVMVVIGVLAGIAVPKFGQLRERAYVAAVTSDLKAMSAQQEIYQSEILSYANDVSLLTDLTLSSGVTITVNEATGVGWAATGVHSATTGRPCGIYYGTASASNASPATLPGMVVCTP
jgi:prepilin-type N-terminal cleavage/methylation domain-containing protein